MKKQTIWIFFDVGSTLIDESRAYERRIREMTAGTDITPEMFQQKRIDFAKQNENSFPAAAQFFGLQKTLWPKGEEFPYPDAKTILRYLWNKGYRIGVIANQSPGTSDRLKQWGLYQYIGVVAASAELGFAKPDLRIFKQAFEMAGCQAENAVMIGDRLDNDIAPAKKLGMKTVWIRQGDALYQSPVSPDFQADFTVNNLLELTTIFK